MAFIKSTYADFDNLPSMNLTKKFCFYILSINIQSIGAKFNNLLAFLSILKEKGILIDIINLQETWLSQKWLDEPDNIHLYAIPGYKLLSKGKVCCAHGGLFTYVRDIYDATIRPISKTSKYYEAMFIDIKGDNLLSKCTIANIYRPSTKTSDTDSDITEFIKEFEPILTKLEKERKTLIVSGDFNINLKKYSVFHDLTNEERVTIKDLVNQAKEKTAKSPNMDFKVVGPPWQPTIRSFKRRAPGATSPPQ